VMNTSRFGYGEWFKGYFSPWSHPAS
jgi:hypothetical protein